MACHSTRVLAVRCSSRIARSVSTCCVTSPSVGLLVRRIQWPTRTLCRSSRRLAADRTRPVERRPCHEVRAPPADRFPQLREAHGQREAPRWTQFSERSVSLPWPYPTFYSQRSCCSFLDFSRQGVGRRVPRAKSQVHQGSRGTMGCQPPL